MEQICTLNIEERIWQMPEEEFKKLFHSLRKKGRILAHVLNFGLEDLNMREYWALSQCFIASGIKGPFSDFELMHLIDATMTRGLHQFRA